MIPFQTWLAQIVEYSSFITNALGVRRAWVDGDYSKTSVTDFDELYEQVFDDLDSDAMEKDLDSHFTKNDPAKEALMLFLGELRSVDEIRGADCRLKLPAALLGSEEWSRLVEAARRVVETFSVADSGRK